MQRPDQQRQPATIHHGGIEELRRHSVAQIAYNLRTTDRDTDTAAELVDACEALDLPLSALVGWIQMRPRSDARELTAAEFARHAQTLRRRD